MEEARNRYDNKVLRQQASGRERILAFQKWFQGNNRPVHLKRPMDSLLYKGAMALSFVGIAVSFWSIGLMATGKMKKKE